MMEKINLRWILIAAVFLAVVLTLGIALSSSESNQQDSKKSANQLDALIGRPYPDAVLYDKNNNAYDAQSFNDKNTVLFFSEGIMCYPACWDEIAALANDPQLNTPDAQVFSVVIDRPEQWDSAQKQMPELAKARMLFDRGAEVSRQLGLLNLRSSMHAGAMPGHTYIVLDKQGIVRYVFDDPNMAKNSEKLIAAIAKIKQ